MKRLLILGTDIQLAQFYFVAHVRCPSARHRYRIPRAACYVSNDEEFPLMQAIADKLQLTHETIVKENKYRTLKALIMDQYKQGDTFTTADLQTLSGYSRSSIYGLIHRFQALGYVTSSGRTNGHYYTLVKHEQPQAIG